MKQTLEFSSRAENLATVRAFVRQFLAEAPLPVQELEMLVLGVDEACTNIIRHAYREADKEQPILLSCERLARSLRFRLRDYGHQTDPALFDGRPIDRVEPGGLGLHLIRCAFDEVDFALKKLGTELTLVKKLPLP